MLSIEGLIPHVKDLAKFVKKWKIPPKDGRSCLEK
jgi:hypothetical protein